jgi:hypothetical protein
MSRNPLAIAFLILGALMLVFGLMAADSVASSFSHLFTGKPTDKAIFLIIGGAISLGVGLVMTMRPSRL